MKRSVSDVSRLGCWGSFQDPDVCDYKYENMNKWGNAMFVTPGVIVDGKLVTTDLVDINLGIRVLLGHSYYYDWDGQREMFVKNDPLGNPVISAATLGTKRPSPGRKSVILTIQNIPWSCVLAGITRGEQGDGSKYLALDTGGGL